MSDKITVVFADDHPLFRSGVRQALEREERISIVGEADNGEQALQMIEQSKPAVAVLDINMPRMSGLEVARRSDAMGLDTKVILLTMLEDRRVFLDAMDSGVKGYVLKDGAVAEITRAILAVADDRHFVSPTLSGLLLSRNRSGLESANPALSDLTETELRIFRLIATLKSNQEIADELFVSKRTIENHRVNMARKLRLTSSRALLKFALQNQAGL